MSDIKLPDANRGDRVLLRDPKTDTERVYTLAVRSRSVKKQIRELTQKQIELHEKNGLDVTDAHEKKIVRNMCDTVNVLLEAGENAPPAGDVLFQAWVDEDITDDQIEGLLDLITGGEADPS